MVIDWTLCRGNESGREVGGAREGLWLTVNGGTVIETELDVARYLAVAGAFVAAISVLVGVLGRLRSLSLACALLSLFLFFGAMVNSVLDHLGILDQRTLDLGERLSSIESSTRVLAGEGGMGQLLEEVHARVDAISRGLEATNRLDDHDMSRAARAAAEGGMSSLLAHLVDEMIEGEIAFRDEDLGSTFLLGCLEALASLEMRVVAVSVDHSRLAGQLPVHDRLRMSYPGNYVHHYVCSKDKFEQLLDAATNELASDKEITIETRCVTRGECIELLGGLPGGHRPRETTMILVSSSVVDRLKTGSSEEGFSEDDLQVLVLADAQGQAVLSANTRADQLVVRIGEKAGFDLRRYRRFLDSAAGESIRILSGGGSGLGGPFYPPIQPSN